MASETVDMIAWPLPPPDTGQYPPQRQLHMQMNMEEVKWAKNNKAQQPKLQLGHKFSWGLYSQKPVDDYLTNHQVNK